MKLFKLAAAAVAALAMSSGVALAQQPFTISIDGSSTVFPVSEAAAEAFQQQTQGRVRVTVGESGTGGGFRKFCRGETHISDASRPISTSEMATCRAAGIQYVEIPIAFDALTVVVNSNNPVRTATIAQLRRMWEPAAQGQITRWNQVDPSWPDMPLVLFAPGAASGTFEYFTEAVNGRARQSRTDFTPSEDDNVLVQGVAQNAGGISYFGLAYYLHNQGRLNAVAIDSGNGPVQPSAANVENGTYTPLSRPIFIYVNAAALRRPQVQQFVQFYVNNAARFSQQVGYIPLPASAYQAYLQRAQRRTQGTAYGGRQAIGVTIQEVIDRPLVVEPVQQ
ncbi:MAG: PstS family phosphate ABC transporter substrate-binding protein [Hyphomonadaceae bacterium]|nr:PstS family phosphate ABC transporter substrate-binding protein [Hyphomonadaceae bacterium]GIK47481.1 MAG: protein sphX [Alphaproteobacteria bacterium]